VTFPLVFPALEHAARLGYRRIAVFPYFLFTGILVQRIYDAVDRAALTFPEIEFIKAPYLNDHDLVIETFVERIDQILTGDTSMNCGLCKYRSQLLGFEAEAGMPQQSHHHHVEGIGVGHHHEHDHDHAHHDHHHPYPHAGHPLGPKSMARK
jgi:sirohydrochlorin cobaltochelatase